jgi:hypothetical protein
LFMSPFISFFQIFSHIFHLLKMHLTLFISQNIMHSLFVISIVEKIFYIQQYMWNIHFCNC